MSTAGRATGRRAIVHEAGRRRVYEHAQSTCALVLVSPAFRVRLDAPFTRPVLALLHEFRGGLFVEGYEPRVRGETRTLTDRVRIARQLVIRVAGVTAAPVAIATAATVVRQP